MTICRSVGWWRWSGPRLQPRVVAAMLAVSWLLLLAAFGPLLTHANVVKFSLPALPAQSGDKANVRCVGQTVPKNVFMKVEYETSDEPSQILSVEFFDKTPSLNKYHQKSNVKGKEAVFLTSQEHASIQFCFSNILQEGTRPSPQLKRDITVKIDSGSRARDDKDLQKAAEHLNPAMMELRRFHLLIKELTQEMEEIKKREENMRDTNEEILSRVTKFRTFILIVLVLLAGWQVMYLRNFFKSKRLM